MKLLLTAAGISNASIHDALVDLLGKPVSDASALFVPTAIYALPNGPDIARRVIRGSLGDPFCELGWKSLGVLELTALPSIERELWAATLETTDALLVGGGDCQYLTYWMQRSGLAELLPTLLRRTVYVGLSAGSMIMTRFGTTYGHHALPADSDRSLGLVDIALHPHLDDESFPDNSLANLETLAATISVPSYLIDDQTAVRVRDGTIDVVSEGHWKLITPIIHPRQTMSTTQAPTPKLTNVGTTPATPRKLFVNIPVSDLQRSIDFFEKLGFTFNAQFTDATATAMLVGEDAYFMLLTKEKFASFAKRPIGNPAKDTTAMYALGVDSRAAVEEMVKTAIANGGAPALDPQDHGFMYGWSFYDPDGHHWEVFWMDPSVPVT